ncbi:hypothetical protein L9Z73_12345 [Pseudomonas sp. TNT11]|uniref:Uncharacterized protein n=1 Tax=Pseudomonas emilianonis TaxID=2915812 RepID=A0ABT0EHA2_9PSED|nr:hypothetical protein [Pseudomonas emilianonis]MCK1785108.1 hypothetical protein [Pseudomonas emilianonis]
MRVNRFFLRRNLNRFFFVFWQALRGVAAVMLLCLIAMLAVAVFTAQFEVRDSVQMGADSSSGNRPGWVCGKISGNVIEVPRSAVLFWPEYEGKSTWEKGFTENKKGCDANFTSLSMPLTWPDFSSVSTDEYTRIPYGEFQGLVLTLEPTTATHDDLDYMMRNVWETNPVDVEKVSGYEESLGLYFKDREYRFYPEIIDRYYWQRSAGKVPVVFSCRRQKVKKEFSICTGYFVIEKIGALAKIDIAPSKLKEWPAIVSATTDFVLSKVK